MTNLKTTCTNVSRDHYKIDMILEGHPISMVLEKSQVRELIGVLDNSII